MMKMTILNPGPLSTIQDEGRYGAMAGGFSPSGAMDSRAMKLANMLVGNGLADGCIEMTMSGMTARFECDSVIAITGADMMPKLIRSTKQDAGGESLPMYHAVAVKKGDVLTMGAAKKGMRCYLAVAGGFDLPGVMGSMSTNLKCTLGGFQGRCLQAGDELFLRRESDIAHFGPRCVKAENDYPERIIVRVVLGPQEDYFTEKGINTFLQEEYAVSDQSDRMGVRLEGSKIESKDGVDIISDGIVTGSVQIPASGTPIIMMADRQTTGGYAKIATVISVDVKKIAQARPGTRIRFQAVNVKEAVRLRRQEEAELKALENKLLRCADQGSYFAGI